MSIPHKDAISDDNLFYELIKNSSEQFKKEVYDIYFGKNFYYEENQGRTLSYGNVMGVEASNGQLDNLFRIQDEFGIEISLTMNQMNIPFSLYVSENRKVLNSFLDFIQGFYDRGLRNCTISANHLMASGMLHERFPDMKWKNTVNHQVSNAQQVLDYLALGYNIIQLDRSLNRNIDELKKIKMAVEEYRKKNPSKVVKTSLLVSEGCLPFCPYKREHDDIQIHGKYFNYWYNFGNITCTNWRYSKYGVLPRSGINCIWIGADTFREFASLVDIFKWSGRLGTLSGSSSTDSEYMGCYVAAKERLKTNTFHRTEGVSKEIAWAESWTEVIENNYEPVSAWMDGFILWPKEKNFFPERSKILDRFKQWAESSLWLTEEGRKLEQRLKNCKNQCYDCHLCEKVFGLPEIDSLISYMLEDEKDYIGHRSKMHPIRKAENVRLWPLFKPPKIP